VCQESELALSLLEQAVDLAGVGDNTAAAAFYTLNLGFAHSKMAESAAKLDEDERLAEQRALAIAQSTAAAGLTEGAGDLWTLRVALCNGPEFLSAVCRNDVAIALLDRWTKLPGEASPSLRAHHLYTLGWSAARWVNIARQRQHARTPWRWRRRLDRSTIRSMLPKR